MDRTLASVLQQDLNGLTDAACDRIRTCVTNLGDEPAAERLEPAVRTSFEAFLRAWAAGRAFEEEELAAITATLDLSDHGPSSDVLLHAHRVAIDEVRDHIERLVANLHPRLAAAPSAVMRLLQELGVARSLERQLTSAIERAVAGRDRAHAAERPRLEGDLVAALLDMPTDTVSARRLLRELGLTVDGPWTVAAVPATRRPSQVRAMLRSDGLVHPAVSDRGDVVVVLADDTPAALAAAFPDEETAGIGARANVLTDVRRSAEEAASALTISARRGVGPVRADRADLDLLIIGALTPAQLIERMLAPIATMDGARRDMILETVEAYLDAGTSITAAARALSLHRESLRYRMTQLRQLFGDDLDDVDRRLALHLAVKALRRAR